MYFFNNGINVYRHLNAEWPIIGYCSHELDVGDFTIDSDGYITGIDGLSSRPHLFKICFQYL